ncbi:hypothetical protein E4U13_007026 [Claviceps humidiphila]|uniref:Protein kinase domain-containing protein n=1 Tax=Claviceps humidiphila TaxID=1294629 RepID=A0A9P7PW76_9HYPO|nr:hypothetical protein E4U13_007026 [Claviceps humidiphila]
MEVYQSFDLFVEKDGDVEFRFTKIIIRGPNRDFYYAITEDRVRIPITIDLDKLNKIPIDTDTIWPRYSARLLQAPSPVPQDSYLKETDLYSYEECPKGMEAQETPLSDLVLHEIEAYELLSSEKASASQYCRIPRLRRELKDSTPFDKDLLLEGIDRGIRHLHSLGIVHNDINPTNIMFDELDRPVIIDFDSWGREGQKLERGMKKGTLAWSINGLPYEYALFRNDVFGLSRLKEFIYDPKHNVTMSR